MFYVLRSISRVVFILPSRRLSFSSLKRKSQACARCGQELKQVNIYTMIGAYLCSENGPVINTGRLPRGYLFEIVTQTGDRSMKRVIIQ